MSTLSLAVEQLGLIPFRCGDAFLLPFSQSHLYCRRPGVKTPGSSGAHTHLPQGRRRVRGDADADGGELPPTPKHAPVAAPAGGKMRNILKKDLQVGEELGHGGMYLTCRTVPDAPLIT